MELPLLLARCLFFCGFIFINFPLFARAVRVRTARLGSIYLAQRMTVRLQAVR
jgi:hypothetical protein